MMADLTWENARWAKGPLVVLFLERHKVVPKALGTTTERAISRWRSGAAADFYLVDKILIGLGFHPSELENEFGSEVWCEFRDRTQPFPVDEVKDVQRCEGCQKLFERELKHNGQAAFWRHRYCSAACRNKYGRSREVLGRSFAA